MARELETSRVDDVCEWWWLVSVSVGEPLC